MNKPWTERRKGTYLHENNIHKRIWTTIGESLGFGIIWDGCSFFHKEQPAEIQGVIAAAVMFIIGTLFLFLTTFVTGKFDKADRTLVMTLLLSFSFGVQLG